MPLIYLILAQIRSKILAYIKKRGNSWQAQVSWYDTDNTRKYKTKSGFTTKMQAKKWPINLKSEKIRIKSRIMTLFLLNIF